MGRGGERKKWEWERKLVCHHLKRQLSRGDYCNRNFALTWTQEWTDYITVVKVQRSRSLWPHTMFFLANKSIIHALIMTKYQIVISDFYSWMSKSNFTVRMVSKKICLAIIQHLNSGTEGQIVTIFHIWWDTELVTLILGAHLEAAASFQQHPYFKHCLLSWRQLCTLSESALMAKQACEHVKRLWLFLFLSVNLLITFYTLTDIQQ